MTGNSVAPRRTPLGSYFVTLKFLPRSFLHQLWMGAFIQSALSNSARKPGFVLFPVGFTLPMWNVLPA